MEALRTVNGEENLRDGYKKGVGGSPIIIRVERSAAAKLRLDVPGYYEPSDGAGYRPSQVRLAFVTNECILPTSISFIETDSQNECKKLLKEIDGMTNRPTFGFGLEFDFRNRRVYRT